MRELHDASNSGNELFHLRCCDHKWRCDFQDHEIISTDLSKNAVIAKQPHNQDLTEHCGMNLREFLKCNSQTQATRSGEFNSQQKPHATDFLYHFVRGKLLSQTDVQLLSHTGGTVSQLLTLQHLQRGQTSTHRRLFSLNVDA